MEIILNEEKTSMWGLAETDIFLTYSNLGPVEIDWSNLTLKQQIALRSAFLHEHILCEDGIPEIETSQQESVGEVPSQPFRQPTAPNPETMVPDIVAMEAQKMGDQKQLEKDAKGLLKKHIGTIKTSLEKADIDHTRLLQVMERLEKKKKRSRPKVLDLISKTLERIQTEAASAIAQSFENGEGQKGYIDPKKIPKCLELTDDHTETGETVTFNPGTGEITKNQEATVI